jgi:hypothetical protein
MGITKARTPLFALFFVLTILMIPLGAHATSWDVSTATYDTVSLSVQSSPEGIFFKADGTKMYIAGFSGTSIYEYTLATPWDLSTATYDNKSKSVSAQGSPISVYFSSDGSSMYVSTFYSSVVYQYTLATPWDVSTATYASLSKSYYSQNQRVYGTSFSPDLSKFYVLGNYIGVGVYQYTLATPGDISTASYTSKFKSVSTQDTFPVGVTFSADGSTMYVVGYSSTYKIFQYTLSTPWDVSTATYSSKSLNFSSQDTSFWEVSFNADGSKMYGLGSQHSKVYQYSLAPADAVAPTVSLTAPIASSTVGGASVSLTATSSDNVAVAGVKFYVDGTLQGSEATSSPYSVTWNSTATTSSAHTAFAVARDTSNNYATSSVVSFMVDNAAPVLGAPAKGANDTWIRLSWISDKAASSLVRFGLTSSYGSTTPEIDTSPRLTGHVVDLHNLVSCTTYHYQLSGTDSLGNVGISTTDDTFTTSGCGGGSSIGTSTESTLTVSSGMTQSLSNGNDLIVLTIPANATATSSSLRIQIKALSNTGTLATPSATLSLIASTTYDVKALIDASTTLDSFTLPVTIVVHYLASDISSLIESSLQLYHYHGGAWVPLDGCSVDTTAKTVTCTTPSFSTFALFGSPVATASVTATTQSSSSHAGGSIQEQRANLIAMGKTAEANALETEWPQLFAQATSTPSLSADTASSSSISSASRFARDLEVGITGADVRALQHYLNTNGFTLAISGPGSSGNETTFFGALTRAAVIGYQNAHHIFPAVGYVGPVTRASIF